jgi:hypothetical protein
MHALIMVAQLQGDGIGRAAQLGHLGRRQGAGRQRQAGTLAGQAGGARLVGDLHFRLARDGAHGAGGGPFELFLPRLVGLAGHEAGSPKAMARCRAGRASSLAT